MPNEREKEIKPTSPRGLFPPKLKAFLLREGLYLLLIVIMFCAFIYVTAEANAFKDRCIIYYESQPAFILSNPQPFTETYKPFHLNQTEVNTWTNFNLTN